MILLPPYVPNRTTAGPPAESGGLQVVWEDSALEARAQAQAGLVCSSRSSSTSHVT